MTPEKLKNMRKDLVTLGSHSVTHPKLTLLEDKKVEDELIISKKYLEDIWGDEINIIAYPYDAYNQKILKQTKKAGYKKVFVGHNSFYFPKENDFVTGRISISPDDWLLEYQLKFRGAYQWLFWAVAFKRKLFNHINIKKKIIIMK